MSRCYPGCCSWFIGGSPQSGLPQGTNANGHGLDRGIIRRLGFIELGLTRRIALGQWHIFVKVRVLLKEKKTTDENLIFLKL